MNKKPTWSIGARLFTGFFLFCILLAGIGYYTTHSSMTTLAEHTKEHTLYFAEKMRSDFEIEIDRKRRMLFLYTIGSKLWESTNPAQRLKEDLIEGVEKEYGLRIFNRAILTDSDGNCIADTRNLTTGNLADQTWWIETKELGYYADSIRENSDSEEMNVYFPLSVQILDKENRFAGILSVDINLSVFTQQMATSALPHRTSQVRILSSSGRLLFSTQPYIPHSDITGKSFWNMLKDKDTGFFIGDESGFQKSYGFSKLENSHRASPWYFLVDSHMDEVFRSALDLQRTNYIILGFVILLGMTLAYFISRTITKPLFALKTVVEQVGPENLTLRTNISSSDEVGRIASSFDTMMDLLQDQAESLTQQNWIETGQNTIGKTMRKAKGIPQLCTKVLTDVAHYMNASIGACYVEEDGIFHRKGSYAFMKGENTPDSYALNEGLVGQTAAEGIMRVIEQFPDDYLFIGSSIGSGSPRTLVEVPVILNEKVKGVIELGFITDPPPLWKELITAVTRDFAVSLDSLQKAEMERKLLRTTEEQKQELQSQQEELRVTNEELEEQTERLRLSEDSLKQQQAELENTNAELEEKNVALKEKQETIERSRRELIAKAEELNRESRYKSDFLSNMSHELRTPLNSLLLLSQDLMNNEPKNLNEEQIESAQIIYNGGKDLLALINQILDMSKIEAGKMELHPDTFRVENFRNILEHTFSRMAEEKGIEFTIEMDPKAPKQIVTDVMRVEQILRNLVSNAIKFTERGSVHVHFSREIQGHNQMLGIRVIDTGIGIPQEQQKDIFSAFHQGESGTSRRFGGTGLGLTITRELTGLLGGTLSLESVKGEGTAFTVLLPLSMKAQTQQSTDSIRHSEPDQFSAEQREEFLTHSIPTEDSLEEDTPPVKDDRANLKDGVKTILVIEDDIRFLSTVMKQCKERGFNCIGEFSGKRGLKSARTYHPDGIILDLHLPEMDGYQVLEQLKNDTDIRHIPVHIMSVENPSLKVYKQGVIGFLTKPVSRQSLDTALNKLISFSDTTMKRILIVEDDKSTRENITKLLKDPHIEIDSTGEGKTALALIQEHTYQCIVLDLGLADMSGYQVIEKLQEMRGEKEIPPVIIYTGQDVQEQDILKLRESPQSIILKDVNSEERLLDEVTLFLHQVVDSLDEKKRQVLTNLHTPDTAIAGHRILVVDDDMRALFAVAKTLSRHGLQVVKAESGTKALSLIESDLHFDLVLMDIMMPEMDGFETIEKLRMLPQGTSLPIIALTAKAMKGDREKCIRAGANDYLSKPIDVEKLLSLIRVWLYT